MTARSGKTPRSREPLGPIIRGSSSAPILPKTRARTRIAHACWGRSCIRLSSSSVSLIFVFLMLPSTFGSFKEPHPPLPKRTRSILPSFFFVLLSTLSTFYSGMEVIYRAAMRCYATLTSCLELDANCTPPSNLLSAPPCWLTYLESTNIVMLQVRISCVHRRIADIERFVIDLSGWHISNTGR